MTGDSRSDIYVHTSTGAASADVVFVADTLPVGASPTFSAYETSFS